MDERARHASITPTTGNLTVAVGATASAGVLLAAGKWELWSTVDCYVTAMPASTAAATNASVRLMAFGCPYELFSHGNLYLSALRITSDGSLYASRTESF